MERSLTYQPAGTVSRHDVHEGGFARPRGTHDGRQLSGFELPRHALRKNTLLVINTNKIYYLKTIVSGLQNEA